MRQLLTRTIALTAWAALALEAQPGPPASCSQFGPACLYQPASGLRFNQTRTSLSYKDVANLDRPLSVDIRIPAVAGDAPLPVVIWSPGRDLAAASDDAPLLKNWSDASAAAGYLTVTIAHHTRDEAQKNALCATLKIPADYCPSYDTGVWDRARDLQVVLANVAAFNEAGPPGIRGRLDLARVAVAGFATGADAAASAAGAGRMLTPAATRTSPNNFGSDLPVAFVLLSPSAPGGEGFYERDYLQPLHSYVELKRPILVLTGAGDNDCAGFAGCQSGATPALRTIPYQLMPAGGKSQFFLRSVLADHSFYGSLDTADCASKEVDASVCDAHASYLKSTVFAFLDANLRQNPGARLWLREGLIEPASSNAVQWRQK